MSLPLQAPLDAYVAASNAQDASAIAALFTDDGVVHDEGGEYHGPAGVLAWRERVHQAYTVTIEPLMLDQRGELTVLRAKVEGNFPGSPIELDFDFTLTDDDRIAALSIHP